MTGSKMSRVSPWLEGIGRPRSLKRLADYDCVQRLEFRHDRILEYCLSQTITRILLSEADDRDEVADPFFTPSSVVRLRGRTCPIQFWSGSASEIPPP